MPMAIEKDSKRRTDKSSADTSDSEKDTRSKKSRAFTRHEEKYGKDETRHRRRDAKSPDREDRYSRSRQRDERRKDHHESRQRSRSRDRTDRTSSRRTDKHSSQDHGRSHDRDRREREDRSPHHRRDRSPSERNGRHIDDHRREEGARNKDSSNYGLRQNSKRAEEDKTRAIKQQPLSDTESDRQNRNRRDKHRDNNRANIFRDDETAGMSYGKPKEEPKEDEADKPLAPKVKPDFGLSGKLAEETNVCNGVVVKYSEPPEARRPKRRWRFYVFKGDEPLPTLYLHRQSAFLIGRDRKVADMPIDHPSCSKQHAVLQFRLVNYDRPDCTVGRTVRPYIIDLGSSNGTFLNNQKIEAKRYVELMEKDVLKFGFSSREYVLLHEDSKDEAAIDDLGAEAGTGDDD